MSQFCPKGMGLDLRKINKLNSFKRASLPSGVRREEWLGCTVGSLSIHLLKNQDLTGRVCYGPEIKARWHLIAKGPFCHGRPTLSSFLPTQTGLVSNDRVGKVGRASGGPQAL